MVCRILVIQPAFELEATAGYTTNSPDLFPYRIQRFVYRLGPERHVWISFMPLRNARCSQSRMNVRVCRSRIQVCNWQICSSVESESQSVSVSRRGDGRSIKASSWLFRLGLCLLIGYLLFRIVRLNSSGMMMVCSCVFCFLVDVRGIVAWRNMVGSLAIRR